MAHRPLRVHLDGTAFMQHRRSGISRYFAELVNAFDADDALGIRAVTPYRYLTNVHAHSDVRRFRSLPLPRRARRPVLERLNRRHRRRTGPVDVTHYPLYEPGLLPDLGRTPAVTTVYDFTFERFPDLFPGVAAELAAKRAYLEECDALVCISEATRRDLHHFHPGLDKPVSVTPLAVADEFRRAADRPVRGLPERYLLHVGNRAEHKNLDLLLHTFRALAEHDPGLHLVLSGQGLPGEADRLAELGIADRVHVVRVSDHDLPATYRNADAFVLPSRYEGFGLPLLEAMAAGCPTLISDTPALVEVAGGAADVVGPDDVDGATAALQRLLRDAEYADRKRAEGRARAEDFTWRRTARLTTEAYHQASGAAAEA